MLASSNVVYCAIDDLISPLHKGLTGFPEFLDALANAGIPCVWVTSRTRQQLDASLRKFGHSGPFIGEGGSAVFLPADYFHLKSPQTLRLGRFTCIPVASPQPAAAQALDALAEDTRASIVPLRSLTPRELSHNVGLPQREAELVRQRDFDELFFFAGVSSSDTQAFRQEALRRKLALRPRGSLWSLGVGCNLATCIRELSTLFERAAHRHLSNVGISTSSDAQELSKVCDRFVFLADRESRAGPDLLSGRSSVKTVPLFSRDSWQAALDAIGWKRR